MTNIYTLEDYRREDSLIGLFGSIEDALHWLSNYDRLREGDNYQLGMRGETPTRIVNARDYWPVLHFFTMDLIHYSTREWVFTSYGIREFVV